jgi:hypothetical protein
MYLFVITVCILTEVDGRRMLPSYDYTGTEVLHLIRYILVLVNEVAASIVKDNCYAMEKCQLGRESTGAMFWDNQT